ncbi:MAG: alcohol dehydrogenase catalytic domain-containing protein [Eggerthellaceae bacterium]|jgi:NADPH2:quinone reductase
MTEANPRTFKKTMLAIRIGKVTPARDAHLAEVPVPETRGGWIRIKVRGIGLNRSEQVLRLGEVERDYIAKPVIPGIECVGEVDDPGTADLKVGQRVCALMGGMGRSFDGSYAEYVLVPARHVFALPPAADDLPWETLAAIPETFFTAWGVALRMPAPRKGRHAPGARGHELARLCRDSDRPRPRVPHDCDGAP